MEYTENGLIYQEEKYSLNLNEDSKENGNNLNSNSKKNEKEKILPLFFVFSKKTKKVYKFINSVPYVCPFPDCNRHFFNLMNWEKHLEQH